MAKERTALVLGGGGLKGLAHIGAWRAIQEAGIAVTEVIGTSIGALVGGAIAGGASHDDLADVAQTLQKAEIISLNRWALLFNGIRQESIFRGDVFRTYIEKTLPGATFEGLNLPLSMNAVDFETGESEWFGAGGRSDVALCDAVYASCALPVFYPPARVGDRFYVDGGICDPLPVAFALARGADRVIAVDVAAAITGDAAAAVEKGMVAIHHRTVQIMGGSRSLQKRAEGYPPNVIHVRPALEGYDTFDFGNTDYFLAEGYRAARQALGDAGERAVGSSEGEDPGRVAV